ncbi:unnamed protein product [Medioppia subpectinata]|uniref:Uncharacterized protein n=1 Tax=Medioppia subpectinata TaxID=1979941 RepID=A0A7R9QI38_9ACAR|nr:unnamed protein product [Medioppia subpectinata]CAG2120380.1 unnamed protein product [Medioppia subpectinata]
MGMKYLMASGVVGLVITVIGLVGIIKENICIVIVLLVLTFLGVISNLVTREYGAAAWGIVCGTVTGLYLRLLIQKRDDIVETVVNKV